MANIFEVSAGWRTAFPGAHAGVLAIREATNPAAHPGLEDAKAALVADLRLRYAGLDRAGLLALPTLRVYDAYYARFKKTYHVQLQLESILFKGKSIPAVAGLVEAMFMAEVKNQLLTAGHDLDVLALPARLDVTRGEEVYTRMRGEPQQVKADDMAISDGQGILSNIIYGPDQRSQIRPESRSALYTVYAPAGIEPATVESHLKDIEGYVHLFAPQARTELREIFG